MLRAECIKIKGLVLDCQFYVVEDFVNNMEEVQHLQHAYLNGVDIANVITEEFTEELISEYYKTL